MALAILKERKREGGEREGGEREGGGERGDRMKECGSVIHIILPCTLFLYSVVYVTCPYLTVVEGEELGAEEAMLCLTKQTKRYVITLIVQSC